MGEGGIVCGAFCGSGGDDEVWWGLVREGYELGMDGVRKWALRFSLYYFPFCGLLVALDWVGLGGFYDCIYSFGSLSLSSLLTSCLFVAEGREAI